MKLRNKIAAITAAAMLAFTGVGFASWVFTNKVQTQDVSGTPKITCAVELSNDFRLYKDGGVVEVPALYLICDAPDSNTHTLGGHGVYWSTAADSTAYANKLEDVYIKGTLNYDGNDIDDLTSITVSFTKGTNYALANGTYVTFAEAALPAAVTIADAALVDGAEVTSASFKLPVPSYTSAVDAFDDITDVDNVTAGLANLKIAYQAQITAKVAA